MTYSYHLPSAIADPICTRFIAEFAGVSWAGVPIDAP